MSAFRTSNGYIFAIVVAMVVAGSGCEPGSWWGVRHVKGIFEDKDESAAEEPSEKEESSKAKKKEKKEKKKEKKASVTTEEEGGAIPPTGEIESTDLERGKQLVREERFAEAKVILLDVTRKEPNNPEAWRWLGESQYNLMQLEEAIESFQKALDLDPKNYYSLRGGAFARLHHGHQLWKARRIDEAHDLYRKALEDLQLCLRMKPSDMEAMYGRAMAAEGASRKLYTNAVGYLSSGKRQQAEVEARNCMEVIDEGIKAAQQRIYAYEREAGPRILAGGLYMRRACLLKEFDTKDQAIRDMEKAIELYSSVVKDVDPENSLAQSKLRECESLLSAWKQ